MHSFAYMYLYPDVIPHFVLSFLIQHMLCIVRICTWNKSINISFTLQPRSRLAFSWRIIKFAYLIVAQYYRLIQPISGLIIAHNYISCTDVVVSNQSLHSFCNHTRDERVINIITCFFEILFKLFFIYYIIVLIFSCCFRAILLWCDRFKEFCLLYEIYQFINIWWFICAS